MPLNDPLWTITIEMTGVQAPIADDALNHISALLATIPGSSRTMTLRARLEGLTSLSAVCKCCVDNECECEGRKTGSVTRTGEIIEHWAQFYDPQTGVPITRKSE